MADVKIFKEAVMPTVWVANAVYYVKVGARLRVFVTDATGTPVLATSLPDVQMGTVCAAPVGGNGPAEFRNLIFEDIPNLGATYVMKDGNAFGGNMVIGTNDNYALYFKINGAAMSGLNLSNYFFSNGIVNYASSANAAIDLLTTGTTIRRNVGASDANTVLTVTNNHADSTGAIQDWKNNVGVVARLTKEGRLGLNSTTLSNIGFRNSVNISGSTASTGTYLDGAIGTGVTGSATYVSTNVNAVAGIGNITSIRHYMANQGTLGSGSTATEQNGFYAASNMQGATNNYGFRGAIPYVAGSNNWNLYCDGSGYNFLASRLGIGTTSLSNSIVHIVTPLAGATTMYTHLLENRANTDVTGSVYGYVSSIGLLDSVSTGNMIHYHAQQGSFGTSTAITTQVGYNVSSNMVSGTNNYGFRSQISYAAGSNRWNFYAEGTAWNFFGGRVGLGSTALSNISFRNNLPLTGATSSIANYADGQVQSDSTVAASYYATQAQTAPGSYTVGQLNHFTVGQGTIGAGSAITTQTAFNVGANIVGATNNYGFRGQIPSGTGRYNLFMDGTAYNYIASRLGIGTSSPAYLLDVNAGTTTSTDQIINVSQNGGSLGLGNSTAVANTFVPLIKGIGTSGAASGMVITGQGSNSYSTAAVLIIGSNAGYTGSITSGNLFKIRNHATDVMNIDYAGAVTLSGLGGSGTRFVSADSTGKLIASGSAIPVSAGGTGATSLTGVMVGNSTGAVTAVAGTAGQLLRRDAANTGYEFYTPAYVDANIYTADGLLMGNRTLNGGGKYLVMNNLSTLSFNADDVQVAAANDIAIQSNGGLVEINSNTGLFLRSNNSISINSNASLSGADLRFNTQALTLSRTASFQDKDGVLAYLDDIKTLYNSDGTLTGNRTVDTAGKTLWFADTVGTGSMIFNSGHLTLSGNLSTRVESGGTMQIVTMSAPIFIDSDEGNGSGGVNLYTNNNTTGLPHNIYFPDAGGTVALVETLGDEFILNQNSVDQPGDIRMGGTIRATALQSSVTDTMLKSDASGKISNAQAGVDYLDPSSVESGTYSPAVSSGLPGSFSTKGFKFMRVGNIVQVSGIILATGVTTGVNYGILVELPVPTTVTDLSDVIGNVTGVPNTIGNTVSAYFGGNMASVLINPVNTNETAFVTFQYIIQ